MHRFTIFQKEKSVFQTGVWDDYFNKLVLHGKIIFIRLSLTDDHSFIACTCSITCRKITRVSLSIYCQLLCITVWIPDCFG